MIQTALETVDKYAWWSSLNHGGLLIAPTKLGEFLSEDLPPLPYYQVDRLRRDLDLWSSGEPETLGDLLDTVLERILGLRESYWLKGQQVGGEWSQTLITGEKLKPRRVWQNPYGGILPVFTAEVSRLGIGKGKRAVSRVIEWLRRSQQKIALLTNGQQWRLIHAGADYDAWCEADTSLWLIEGQLGPQVFALRSLLSERTLTLNPTKTPFGNVSPLLGAIAASRQGQAELSEQLGERVRQAVELLIQELLNQRSEIAEITEINVNHQSLYIAATRFIMRAVFILFAEARNLLPRDHPIYNQSYSLQGLREQLERTAGGRASERLRHRYGAYPRLLALFRLIYHGCSHEALPIPQYGGELFKPGNALSSDTVLQALAWLEQPTVEPSDEMVYRILELLTKAPIKVRQGKGSLWVMAPVDFSDLSSEYIGILYEGLLDFELRRAEPDNPMIFLNLGNQPVLPLSRLEEMDDKSLEALVEKLKKQAKAAPASEEGEDTEEDSETEDSGSEDLEEETEDNLEEIPADLETETLDDQVAALRQRTHQ